MNKKCVTSSLFGLNRWLALGQYRVTPIDKNNARSGQTNLPHNYASIIHYNEKTVTVLKMKSK